MDWRHFPRSRSFDLVFAPRLYERYAELLPLLLLACWCPRIALIADPDASPAVFVGACGTHGLTIGKKRPDRSSRESSTIDIYEVEETKGN